MSKDRVVEMDNSTRSGLTHYGLMI